MMDSNKFSGREFLAAGGVILSLLFVGLEVQQNTNAIKATAIQEFVSGYREQAALYINDPDMARIIQLAQKDIAKLNDEEEQRYFGWVYAGSLLAQSAFRQWQLGVLPDEEWSIVAKMMCQDASHSNNEVKNKMLDPFLVPSFVKAIDDYCNAE
jgi:hypothetical protein